MGTVGSPGKIDAAVALGHDKVLLADQFPDALDGEQVDLVVDAVGGNLRKPSLDVLAPLGRILVVGHASTTPEAPILGNELWRRNLGIVGFSVGTLTLAIEELPLTAAAEAHRRLENRETAGRINLTTT
jgi:NADPH2:quinone reductase